MDVFYIGHHSEYDWIDNEKNDSQIKLIEISMSTLKATTRHLPVLLLYIDSCRRASATEATTISVVRLSCITIKNGNKLIRWCISTNASVQAIPITFVLSTYYILSEPARCESKPISMDKLWSVAKVPVNACALLSRYSNQLKEMWFHILPHSRLCCLVKTILAKIMPLLLQLAYVR